MRPTWCLALLLLATRTAGAQLVRGRVTERASGTPLGGVVIEAWTADDHVRVAAALSTADGGYAVRLPAAGRYYVSAKRIGVRRARSESFEIQLGETTVRNLEVEALLYTLPEVVITGIAACSERAADVARIAALWEEARTALFATQLSLRDELFRAHVTRYVRELDARALRILSETRSEVAGVVSRPFSSVDAESLSIRGYWWNEPDGSMVYYGPDADVLLSDAFLRDHCFREVTQRNRRGMIGLGFRPVPSRTLPDVVGTLWLDERTFELRFVEFTYRRGTTVGDPGRLGGEVHFARLPSGAWIVRRWFIRLPVTARPTSPLATRQTSAPWVLVRPIALPLREEGGEVAAEELVRTTAMVTLQGMVRDSSNRPWADVSVRVAGTRLATRTRTTGAFSLDSVPHGAHTILVEAEGYDSLGLGAADARIEVGPARTPSVTLRALDGRALFTRLCPGHPTRRGTGALRVAVRSLAGDSTFVRLPLQFTWQAQRGDGSPAGPPGFATIQTDDNGRITWCTAPSDVAITIIVARPDGGSEPGVVVKVPDRGARGVIVRLGTAR